MSAGVRLEPTVANVEFSYQEGGKAMRGLVIGTTSDSGPFWIASVSGIATTGDPKASTARHQSSSTSGWMDLGKLRALGLRPDDYEEVKIKK